MRFLAAITVISTMILGVAFAPAAAGYKEQWVKFRTQMTDKADSKALCWVLMPWPGKCSCDMDSDGDGIMDGKDQCPGTPAGAKVDSKGCCLDSDKDGVFDGIDKCPNTPAGTKVDESGCPVAVRKFINTGKITTSEILFDTGKATLKSESKKIMNEIGTILIQVSDLKVEIGGHTDSQGSDSDNLKLSDERAKAVHDYLEKNFSQIKSDNLVSKGYGESTPVATNDTAEGRAQNRRVEFKIVK